ncbi:MAG: hypothetical protein QW478_13515 [Candidatus Micrarchaeaceae archaeon]
MARLYTYKITLSNTTSTATPPNLQVRLNINFSAIEGLNPDLSNIRFSSDPAGFNLLYAWLESAPQGTFTQGTSVSSYTSSNVWVNLGNNIIPANGSLTIYMQVLSSGTEFDGVYWGANPQWTSTYGQYDNGANVFNNYWNFAGTSAPSGWVAVKDTATYDNGVTITGSNGGYFYYTGEVFSGNIVVDDLTQVTTQANVAANGEGMAGITTTSPYWTNSFYGSRLMTEAEPTYGYVLSASYGVLTNTVPMNTPTVLTFEGSSTGMNLLGNYVSQMTSTDTVPSQYYIVAANFDSGAVGVVQWVRTRTYPPNGTDPVLTSISILPSYIGNYSSASIPSPEWTALSGKPYITVSAKGISNGLSSIPNDGADFGPDTLLGANSPNQYGPPYTQTSGIQEAFTYLEPTGGYIEFGEGAFYLNTTATYTSEHALKIRGIRPNFTRGGPLVINGTIFMPGPNWNEPSETPMLMFLNTGAGNNDGFLDFSGAGFIGVYLQAGDTIPYGPSTTSVAAFQCGNTTSAEGNGPVAKNITDMKIIDCRPAWISYSGGGPNFYDKLHVDGCGSAQLYDSTIHIGMIDFFSVAGNFAITINNAAGGGGGNPPLVYVDQIYSTGGALGTFLLNTSQDDVFVAIGKINIAGNANDGNAFFGINGSGSVTIEVGEIYQIGSSILRQYSSTNTPLINVTIGSLYSINNAQIVTGGNSFASGSSLTINNFYANSLATGYTFTNFMIGNLLTKVNNYLPMPTPTLSANPPVSGTVYQNLNVYDIRIYLPAYATTSGTAGSVAIALGSSSSPSTIGTKFINGSTSSSATEIIELVVPAGWYYEFTSTGVTFGTATVLPA